MSTLPRRPSSLVAVAAAGLLFAFLASPCAAQAVSSPAGAAAPSAGAAPLLFDLPVPGGLNGLFAAARLAPAPRPVALLTLIRLLHLRPGTGTDARRLSDAVDSRLASASLWSQSSSDVVPLPLSPDIWLTDVFKSTVLRDDLVRAILRDRRAAFLYYGLLSLDDSTLAFLQSHPSLVAAIYVDGVGPFATCGRSIHVKDDAVVLPGGPAVRRTWEAIVGEAAGNAEAFILALLRGDGGRRAYFLDTLAHLDGARQAFALALAEGERAGQQVRRLYEATAAFERTYWRMDLAPFVRQPVDPATILTEVQARPDGRMAPPSSQAFWRAALDGNIDGCRRVAPGDAREEVDAAWLTTRLLREETEPRRALLNAVLFAQRAFGATTNADAPAACAVVAQYAQYPALVATLEHVGFSAPRDYLAALAAAQRLTATTAGNPAAAVLNLAQMQGLMAVLERVADGSPLDRQNALDLIRSLCTPPARESAGRLGEWMRRVLMPRLCRNQESADACLQDAVAGLRVAGRSLPLVEWEGERYRVEPARAFALRLSRVRERQHPTSLDAAMTLVAIGVALRDEPFSQARYAQHAAGLREVARGLDGTARGPHGLLLDTVRSALDATARRLVAARKKTDAAATEVLEASAVVLADSLTSFAYAMGIGDADSSFLLADDPARRHRFLGDGRNPMPDRAAWQLAHEVRRPDAGWTIEGSLLGLSRACALSWQRRLSLAPVPVPSTLDERALHGFAESAAALNPSDLTDAGRTAIAAAIRRGRTALADLTRQPAALALRAAAAGVSEWRTRGAVWLTRHDPAAVAELFALAELMWLGEPAGPPVRDIDAWGVPARHVDGSLAVRVPRGHPWEDVRARGVESLASQVADLHLRVALWLDDMKLPAALAPGLVSFATWDLVSTAQPADPEDDLALMRAAQMIPGDRLVEYVSALTADGTLAPAGRR